MGHSVLFSHDGTQEEIYSYSADNSRRIYPRPSMFKGQRDLESPTEKSQRRQRRAALERDRYWRWVKSRLHNYPAYIYK